MRYTTEAVQVSQTLALATFLRANGYAIRWHAAQTIEPRTAGPDRGTLTLVPDFPANPTTIVRLSDSDPSPSLADVSTIVVPALALQMVTQPARITLAGLGQIESEWAREVLIDGFARDDGEHRHLADLLTTFLGRQPSQHFEITDYSQDAPVPIGPMYVETFGCDRREQFRENDATRFYVNAVAELRYFE